MRNVRITVCKMKLNTGDMFWNMGPNAKLHNMTIVTFTVLLAISIVAKSLSGTANRFLMAFPFGVSSSSSNCAGVNEKKAISLPEIKPEMSRQTAAIDRATICPTPNSNVVICDRRAVAGKGSISKVFDIS